MPVIGSVKGHHLKIAKTYLKDKYPPDAFEKILAQMDEKNRAIAAGNILSISWIPEETWGKFLIAFDHVYGKGDYSICNTLGIYLGKNTMPLFYQIFIKIGNPGFVIQRAPLLWKQMHNNGVFEVVDSTNNSGIVRIKDKTFPHKAFCKFLMGFCQGVLELCGVKKFSFQETQCASLGAPYCEFHAQWK
ncbi:MAG: hypothetical protein ABIG64_09605 [Candidatus Omnitrophota bacterium]